jgi:hypothetical protein
MRKIQFIGLPVSLPVFDWTLIRYQVSEVFIAKASRLRVPDIFYFSS